MNIRKSIGIKQVALTAESERLQKEAERIRRLLPELGKSAAVVGNTIDDEIDLVEVGDAVHSKYGEEGIVTGFENVDAENWCDVRILFRNSATGQAYHQTADRMNLTGGYHLD